MFGRDPNSNTAGGKGSRNFHRHKGFGSEIEPNAQLNEPLIAGGSSSVQRRQEYVPEGIDLRGGAQIRNVQRVRNVRRFGEEFKVLVFAQRENAGVAQVQLEDRRTPNSVPANEQWPLVRGRLGAVAVQDSIAPDVEHIAARRDHADRKAVEIEQILGQFSAGIELRRENTGQIQDVATVGQGVAAISGPIGRIGQRHGVAAIDVVLFGCVVDGVRPRVRRK